QPLAQFNTLIGPEPSRVTNERYESGVRAVFAYDRRFVSRPIILPTRLTRGDEFIHDVNSQSVRLRSDTGYFT
ncbi:hypothetical protein, partial [Acetobacter sp. DsW_063]|uniref:hypothetical protein n=1 Tax=Acetobacter sp. DsW_063 TaxID=1514894 RepID=UPI001E63ECA7